MVRVCVHLRGVFPAMFGLFWVFCVRACTLEIVDGGGGGWLVTGFDVPLLDPRWILDLDLDLVVASWLGLAGLYTFDLHGITRIPDVVSNRPFPCVCFWTPPLAWRAGFDTTDGTPALLMCFSGENLAGWK